jgi:mRNA-degrading endonuclease RelE of RelBE toxin-antitoxin system
LDAAFLRLATDPEAAGVELRGRLRGTWRLREGGYRVLYKIRNGGSLVVVESIRPRRDAYR